MGPVLKRRQIVLRAFVTWSTPWDIVVLSGPKIGNESDQMTDERIPGDFGKRIGALCAQIMRCSSALALVLNRIFSSLTKKNGLFNSLEVSIVVTLREHCYYGHYYRRVIQVRSDIPWDSRTRESARDSCSLTGMYQPMVPLVPRVTTIHESPRNYRPVKVSFSSPPGVFA